MTTAPGSIFGGRRNGTLNDDPIDYAGGGIAWVADLHTETLGGETPQPHQTLHAVYPDIRTNGCEIPHRSQVCKVAAIASALICFALATPSTLYADDGADWLPLTGSDIKVGCTWDNGCSDGYHGSGAKAIDFIVPEGRPVYASGAGIVTQAQGGCGPNSNGCNRYRGNFMTINYGPRSSRYLHLSSIVIGGGSVVAGQLIAYSGSSGQGSIAHLHYDELTDPVKRTRQARPRNPWRLPRHQQDRLPKRRRLARLPEPQHESTQRRIRLLWWQRRQ